MSIKCDVLVIGAGIAGSTCASILDSLGCTVSLIEQHDKLSHSHSQKIDFAEDKNLSTHITKYNLPLTKKTNISRWYSPDNELFEFKSSINDIWCKRGDSTSYENTLLKSSNVSLVLNTKLQKIHKGTIITIHSSKGKVEYKAKYVVIATGNFSPYFSPDKQQKMKQLYYGHGFVVDKLNIEQDIPHIVFDKNMFDNSYLFMVHNSDENISYLAYGSISQKPLSINELKTNSIIGEALNQSTMIKPILGFIYLAYPSTLCYDNILFVGDAANLMDPLFSYGVTNAIKSAVFAAEAIHKGGNVCDNYKKACKGEILPELYRKFKFRILFDSLSNQEINVIIQLLNSLSTKYDVDSLFDNTLKSAFVLTPHLITNSTIRKLMIRSIRWML